MGVRISSPAWSRVVRINYFRNPGFESVVPYGWVSYPGASIVVDSSTKKSGSASAKVTTTAADSGIAGHYKEVADPSPAGVTEASVQVWLTAGDVFQFRLAEWKSDAQPIGSSPWQTGVVGLGDWQLITATYLKQQADSVVRWEIQKATPGVFWVDEAMLGPGTWFSGSTPASGDDTFEWLRSVNLSPSVMKSSVVEPRLVLGWESSRPSRNLVHPIIGRADPDVTLRAAGLRKGRLELFADSYQLALDLEDIHTAAAPLTLTDTDRSGNSMRYVVDGDITLALDKETRQRWVVSVDYQEIAS